MKPCGGMPGGGIPIDGAGAGGKPMGGGPPNPWGGPWPAGMNDGGGLAKFPGGGMPMPMFPCIGGRKPANDTSVPGYLYGKKIMITHP